MDWRDLMVDGFGRIQESLEEALNGLTADDLDRLPCPDCNSIGWLAWHTSRIQDEEMENLMVEEQLWVKGGWHARFNRPPDPKDTGTGHTSEQVAAFRSPDVETFLAYHRAVSERTNSYLAALPASELGRELNEPWWQPVPTVGVRIVSVLADNLMHVGELSYVRGLLKGKGGLKY